MLVVPCWMVTRTVIVEGTCFYFKTKVGWEATQKSGYSLFKFRAYRRTKDCLALWSLRLLCMFRLKTMVSIQIPTESRKAGSSKLLQMLTVQLHSLHVHGFVWHVAGDACTPGVLGFATELLLLE